MTAEALAEWAVRPSALVYANVCTRWGIDPAASLDDPVLAVNLRTVLTIRQNEAEASEADEKQKVKDEFAAFLETPREVEPWRL